MSATPVLADALRDAMRDCYVQGYSLALEHVREGMKLAGIVGADRVLDAFREVPATVEADAVVAKAKATGSAA